MNDVEVLNILAGQRGSRFVDGTDRTAGEFRAINIIEDAVFDEYTDAHMTGDITGTTIKQGETLYGKITSFKLTSGSVIAYG